MFKNERMDQMKVRTSNMFQQCGGSGGSVAVKEITEAHYYYSPQVTDMKICTLERTYRSHHALHMPGSRHCVSDSDLFIHQDADWYRPPRSLACDSSDIYPTPRNINIVSERYPAADDSHVETITTRFQTPGNILVRFKTFLGIDGSTQRVEVIGDNTDYGATSIITSDDSGAVRMKTLFGMKGSAAKDKHSSNVEGDTSTIDIFADKFDKVKTLIKAKRSKRKVDVEVTSTAEIDPNDRIIRMKTLFGNRAPKHVLQIQSQNTTAKSRHGLGRFKTLFKSDASSQTDSVPAHDFIRKASVNEAALSKRYRLKKFLGWSNDQQENDVVVKDFDERRVFSRQSNPPVISLDPEVAPRRLPIWLDDFTKRVRLSCSRVRVNDIELPDAAIDPKQLRVPDQRRRKLGSTSGWQWRHGEEVTQTRKRHSGFKSWLDCKKCRLPKCATRTSSVIRNPQPGEPAPIVEVIALICGVLVVVLMALGLGSADWLMAAGWRQGLFSHCVEEGAPTPLPFNLVELPGCYASRDVAYIRAAAALCIVTLIADVIGSILTALGLHATEHRTKYKYYRLAVLAMALALISILIALVIYPVCFAAELNLGNRTVWEFGWAYGVGWGAAIFLFGAVILLLCDKESEEIYYKERKVEREPPGGGP